MERYGDLESILESSFGKTWKNKWSYNASKPKIARTIIKYFNREDITSELKDHLEQIYRIIKNN